MILTITAIVRGSCLWGHHCVDCVEIGTGVTKIIIKTSLEKNVLAALMKRKRRESGFFLQE